MSELIKLKMEEFLSALDSLKDVLNKSGVDETILRDSAIQRFEFTSELAWKSLKFFLFDEHGIDAKSPKSTYREARKVGLIDAQETQMALKMVDDRNRIAHDYNESFSIELHGNVKAKYFNLLEKIYKVLSESAA